MSDKLSFEALELAIAALEQGLREHEQYPQLLTVRDGVIQRFEIAMDVSRQLMIRVLKEVFSLDAASAQKDTIREAAKYSLIADAEAWMQHLAARNRTSHTYDSAIAEQVFAHIPSFLPDARDLLQRLHTHAA
ncbi:MAG TPA: nucleotidyltransferase substrate binding protein [Sideroxyarcus sp.]|nr:nucleotidyltransferase substrate binding protein [Sideroxyarcus sp.]